MWELIDILTAADEVLPHRQATLLVDVLPSGAAADDRAGCVHLPPLRLRLHHLQLRAPPPPRYLRIAPHRGLCRAGRYTWTNT